METRGRFSIAILKVSCTNLRMISTEKSKRQPMVSVSRIVTFGNETLYKELGQTEVRYGDRNPVFRRTVRVDYRLDGADRIRIAVHDTRNTPRKPTKSNLFGFIECSLSGLLYDNNGLLELPLTRYSPCGQIGCIKVVAEDVGMSKERLVFKARGIGLDKKNWIGKSDPYLNIYRTNRDRSIAPIYRSETVYDSLDPCWIEITIPLNLLCNNDPDRMIRIECNDHNILLPDSLIGVYDGSLRQLLLKGPTPSLNLVHTKKGKNSGLLELHAIQVVREYSLEEWITQGLVMDFVMAVDFTSSNVHPSQPNSLHYIGVPNQPNLYQQVIQAVGNVIESLHADRTIPSYGFGALVEPQQPVSHMFNLGMQQSPVCFGIRGVLDAYSHAVVHAVQSEPTFITPIIQVVADLAWKQHQQWTLTYDRPRYIVLFVLTDGQIDDLDAMKDAIVEASHLPMSIVFFGVGPPQCYKKLERLLEEPVLSSQDRKSKTARKTVHFIPFTSFISLGPLISERMSSATLEELVEQVTSYMWTYRKRTLQAASPFPQEQKST